MDKKCWVVVEGRTDRANNRILKVVIADDEEGAIEKYQEWFRSEYGETKAGPLWAEKVEVLN